MDYNTFYKHSISSAIAITYISLHVYSPHIGIIIVATNVFIAILSLFIMCFTKPYEKAFAITSIASYIFVYGCSVANMIVNYFFGRNGNTEGWSNLFNIILCAIGTQILCACVSSNFWHSMKIGKQCVDDVVGATKTLASFFIKN